MKTHWTLLPVALFFLAAVSGAQQFSLAPGVLPGPDDRWTEGVEAADVDQDGDLDVFLAHGGGWSDATAVAYPNTLLINRLIEDGALTFVDESAARLGGTFAAKMVITGDVDGDGWTDSLFCNCYDGSPPSLYMNRGAAQPGFFDLESALRGLTEALHSYSGAFGDVDDDGDLDLVLGDSTTFWDLLIEGVPAHEGKPRLYLNDGAGYFAEAGPPAWNPALGKGTHDVQMVDVDLDWDVDVIVSNVTGGASHYLMLNDGTGAFVDRAALLPTFSPNCFETEVGDLDGDKDLDLFLVGLDWGPQAEFWAGPNGPVENLLADTGTASFFKHSGSGASDANEVVLVDYDVDGDLDAFVTSLGAPADQVHRNDGQSAFQLVSDVLSAGIDPEHPTLDATCADFDNDGDLDYLSVQGEYPKTNWTNTLFLNSGPPDTLSPVVVREELLGATAPLQSPWVVRAEVADQIMDDGQDWLTASASLRSTDVGGSVIATTEQGIRVASGLYRFEFPDPAEGLGASFEYELRFRDRNGNETVTPTRQVTLTGLGLYGTGTGGANVLSLSGSGSASPGGTVTATSQGVVGPTVTTVLSLSPASVPLFGGTLLVGLGAQAFTAKLTPAVAGMSAVDFPVPADPALLGTHVFVQSAAEDGAQPAGWALSNGLHVAIGAGGSP